jgi:hypothetical protein
MRYTVLEFGTWNDQGHLHVAVDGYPGWAVEVVVMQTTSGLVVSDLHVVPYQRTVLGDQKGTSKLGSRVFAKGEAVHWSPDWSELATDVPVGGIPSRLLREVNLGQLLTLAQQEAAAEVLVADERANRIASKNPDLAKEIRALATGSKSMTGPVKRSGRRGNGTDHYLLWAVRYHEKAAAGVGHPIKELAKEHDETPTYVRDTITDARRRYGLLTTSGQGRAGGQLTPKALDLIAQRKETDNG